MPPRGRRHDELADAAGATPAAHDGVDLEPDTELVQLRTPPRQPFSMRSWPKAGFPPKPRPPGPDEPGAA